jgi:hypothetical protein
LVEAQNINKSLTSLADVLAALVKNAHLEGGVKKDSRETATAIGGGGSAVGISSLSLDRGPGSGGSSTAVVVPYRNSKLTQFLKDSLGGNSATLMVACVRPEVEYFSQTWSSLLWASRARKIRNRVGVNVDLHGGKGGAHLSEVSRGISDFQENMQMRADEFHRLLKAQFAKGRTMTQIAEAKENVLLRNRLQDLSKANEDERQRLQVTPLPPPPPSPPLPSPPPSPPPLHKSTHGRFFSMTLSA